MVALDILVIHQFKRDLVLKAGLLDKVLGILKLLLRQCDATVEARQVDG